MNWKPIVEMTDLPGQAGVEVDLTVENAHNAAQRHFYKQWCDDTDAAQEGESKNDP